MKLKLNPVFGENGNNTLIKKLPFLILLFTLFGSTLTISQTIDNSKYLELIKLFLQEEGCGGFDCLTIYGNFYGAIIDGNRIEFDNNNFLSGGDSLRFTITSDRFSNLKLDFYNVGDSLETWFNDKYDSLIYILFPISFFESLSGSDAGIASSNNILSNYALFFDNFSTKPDEYGSDWTIAQSPKKGFLGGLIEYENLSIDGNKGKAIQGLIFSNQYYSALQFRYSSLNDPLNSKSVAVGIDFHPYFRKIWNKNVFKIGGNIFGSGVFTSTEIVDLGGFHLGAGGWTAIQRIEKNYQIGIGVVGLLTKGLVPTGIVTNEFSNIADEYNKRKMSKHLTYGSILGLRLARNLFLNLRANVNHSFIDVLDEQKTINRILLMGSIGHYIGRKYPIDIGYKFVEGPSGFRATSLFLVGNFRW